MRMKGSSYPQYLQCYLNQTLVLGCQRVKAHQCITLTYLIPQPVCHSDVPAIIIVTYWVLHLGMYL